MVGCVSDGVQSPRLCEDLPGLGVAWLSEFGEQAILAGGAEGLGLRRFVSSL
jgi:hypothetical protein